MKPIPSLKEIFDRMSADIVNELGFTDSELKRVLNAIASALSGEVKLCYLFLQDVQNNLFPDTAEPATSGGELNRFGQLFLRRQPKPATDGIYSASLRGVAGSVIRSGLTFKSNDDSNSPGNLYITETEYILNGMLDVIPVRSLSAGPEFLLKLGDKLTATEPVIGVDQQISIESIAQFPASGENVPLYRQNILNSMVLTPRGGAKTDYKLWASDVQGVRRVYPYVKNGSPGIVQVFVEATKIDSIDSQGTPSVILLEEVYQAIVFNPDASLPTFARGRKPIQATPEVLPVTIKPVDFDIMGLQVDNSSVRLNISSSLESFLVDIRPFISGADLSRDKNNVLTSVKAQSVVTDIIGNVNSFIDFKMYVDGVEVNTFLFAQSNIPYLRNVNYS